MKKLFQIMALAAIILLSFSALSGMEFQRAELEKEIMNRLTLARNVYNDRDTYSVDIIKEIKPGNELSGLCDQLIAGNYFYLDYCIKDIEFTYLQNRDDSIKNPDAVIQGYKDYLNENKENLEPLVEFFALYAKSKGHNITGLEECAKETFSLPRMKAVAVRSVFPYGMLKDGRPAVRVCIAGEGLVDYPNRNKALEAFAFECVFNGSKEEKLAKKIQEYMTLVGQLGLSTDVDVATKRAQGAFWALLFRDEDFEKLLLESYNEKKDYLPFEISFATR